MATICLNMIVKNESENIERCLNSMLSWIDSYVICDTGSTDDTIQKIQNIFNSNKIPGTIHEFPFINWEQARNEALKKAKNSHVIQDYILFADADMELVVDDINFKSRLCEPAYSIQQRNQLWYYNTRLIQANLEAQYIGVTHEYLSISCLPKQLKELWFIDHASGFNRAGKFQRDIDLLLEDLKQNPNNSRSLFYLAQSYRDNNNLLKSRETYRKRIEIGGWNEEIWYSLYQIAKLNERLDEPEEKICNAYLAAYQFRPSRAEPLVELARFYREKQKYHLANIFAQQALKIKKPNDTLFLENSVYRYRAMDEAAIAAFWTGDKKQSFNLCQKLLLGDLLPEKDRQRVKKNASFCVDVIAEIKTKYPEDIIESLLLNSLSQAIQFNKSSTVTLTVTSCKRLDLFKRTINSFLNCCQDLYKINKFICIDDNSSPENRNEMQKLYPFFEFIFKDEKQKGHAQSMNLLFDLIDSNYWLHLEDDWEFIVSMPYIEKAISILESQENLAQVMFNRNYTELLNEQHIVGGILNKEPIRHIIHEYVPGGRNSINVNYFLQKYPKGSLTNCFWPHFSFRPFMMKTKVLQHIGKFIEQPGNFELEYGERFVEHGYFAAFFDAIVCRHIGRLSTEIGKIKNAYDLNGIKQF
ncbi:glycosyltransferase [Picosynechococcus sp. PCC 11901]|uniref:glycosyltransferase n=2 Tax=Picosynechococcus sp. PCC 11901 TaxID=2579791 RepID=UPI0010FC068A|nr:glycosyltransferase [Picosynechococcus sp. PCC 11901]QCS48340.1 glycosyltransferase [Picosynechococcus sp. PCC 11901]